MPLSSDEHVNDTAKEVVSTLRTVFGSHPGYRPAHARGLMLTGNFTPTSKAKTLTTAPHFQHATTPVTVRFSSSTGIPNIPDTDPNANPRGIAVRFNLGLDSKGRRQHTDIVAHSTPHFPVSTGEDFVAFLKAVLANSVPDFLGSHPAALRFVQAPKPFPKTLATEAYYGLNAFKFVDSEGKEHYFRYQIQPDSGKQYLDESELQKKSARYLWDELPHQLPVNFSLYAQLAEEGDVTDDVTSEWPNDRELVKLGTIIVDKVSDNNAAEQKQAIFDPIPRNISGLEPSKDPMLEMRAAVYLVGGRERRAAPMPAAGEEGSKSVGEDVK